MLLLILVTPIALIVIGKRFLDDPPKRSKRIWGYRSRRSLKNCSTWDYAQSRCGINLHHTGWAMFFLYLFIIGYLQHEGVDTSGYVTLLLIYTQIIPIIISCISVEVALHIKFDENGQPRN